MEQTSMILASNREDIAEIRASNARTDRQLLEMQEQAGKDCEQTEKERKEFNWQLAGISDRLGNLIEDMVAPNASRIARTLEILNKDAC